MNTAFFDGVTDLLKRLKQAGKTVVMATSKPEVYAKMIAEDAGITCWFDAICGSDMEGKRLTKEAVIEYALDSFRSESRGSFGDYGGGPSLRY